MDDLCDIKPPSELRKSSIDTGLDEDNSRPVVTQQFLYELFPYILIEF